MPRWCIWQHFFAPWSLVLTFFTDLRSSVHKSLYPDFSHFAIQIPTLSPILHKWHFSVFLFLCVIVVYNIPKITHHQGNESQKHWDIATLHPLRSLLPHKKCVGGVGEKRIPCCGFRHGRWCIVETSMEVSAETESRITTEPFSPSCG